MTAEEAYKKLIAMYPKQECKAWHWIDGERPHFSLDVDKYSGHGVTFEECFKELAIPPVWEMARQKRTDAARMREEAVRLIDEAENLERLAQDQAADAVPIQTEPVAVADAV